MSTSSFVTGATGFLAQHIIQDLLAKNYTVVGSVRTQAKGEKLKKFFGDQFTFEVISDLQDKKAIEAALLKHPEVTSFIHTATPISMEPQDFEKNVLLPAINGVKYALTAISKTSPNIKKVVYTSSMVAMVDFVGTGSANEESWSKVTYEESLGHPMLAYAASKKFAELAAWDYVKDEKAHFTLTVVNPVLIVGPQVIEEDAKADVINMSNGFITNLLNLKEGDDVNSFETQTVDVKNVSQAHIAAIERDDLAGKRLLLRNEDYESQLALNYIHETHPELKNKVIKGDGPLPKGAYKLDDTKTRELLGLKYIPLKDTVDAIITQYVKVNNI